MHAACDSQDPDTIKRNVRGFERHGNGGEGRLSLMNATCDSRDPEMTIKRNVRGFEKYENGGEGRLSLMITVCGCQKLNTTI